MVIDIRGQNLSVSPSLREHVERRVRFALTRFGPQVTQVTVRLVSLNGPGGGPDKRCQVEVRIRRRRKLVADDIQPDPYVAVERATERMHARVARELERAGEQWGR